MDVKQFAPVSILVLLLTYFPIQCQEQMTFHINHLSVEEGLPHVDVVDITEDRLGFIWIATLSGLCKYDGYEVTVFKLGAGGQVDRNRCTSIALGSDHHLWLGTQAGLSLFDIEREREIPIVIGGNHYQVIARKEVIIQFLDGQGNLWITADNQLLKLEISQHKVTGVENLTGILQPSDPLVINAMVQDRNANYWIGTSQGIFQVAYLDGQYRLIHHLTTREGEFRLAEGYIASLALDRNHNLIIGSIRLAEVLRLDYSQPQRTTITERVRFDIQDRLINRETDLKRFSKVWHLRSAALDSMNNCWFATDGGILKLETDSTYRSYRFSFYGKSIGLENSLNSEIIHVLFINREDCLFAGTYGGGVNYFDTRQKEIYVLRKNIEDPASLSENLVRAIVEDSQGGIWVGTQNSGLNYVDLSTGVITHFYPGTNAEGINRNAIRALELEDDRYLWIGTLNEVFCYDIERSEILELPPETRDKLFIDYGYVTDIEIDSFGNMWIGTWQKGLIYCRRDKDNPLLFNEIIHMDARGEGASYIPSDYVNSIQLLRNPLQVMAGTRQGLVHFFLHKKGGISSYRTYSTRTGTESDPVNDFIWDIVEAEDQTFYVGSIGKGLLRLDLKGSDIPDSRERFLEEVVLPEQYGLTDIESLLRDEKGNLWLAGKGLFFYNTSSRDLEAYDFQNAIFNNIFKVGAACRGASGRLYFGGIKGLCYLYPERIIPNSFEPNVQFTGLRVHNRSIKPGSVHQKRIILEKGLAYTDELMLNHLQNDFSISFSSLQFQNPEKILYRYKLEGYDKEWNEAYGEMPVVSYANLKFRKYRLILHASNNDGVWSFEPRVLTITVRPPWWKSKLALGSYFWIIILMLLGIYYNQLRFYRLKHALAISRLEEQKQEELLQTKLRFFTNISHEFRTPISLILSPLEELKSEDMSPLARNRIYGIIDKNARKLLRLINELIEFRKLESEAFQLRTTYTELNGLVRAMVELFQPLAEKKQINLNFEPSGDYIKGWFDPYVVERIVSNILSNAFKYTPDSGEVKVRVLSGEMERVLDPSLPGYNIAPENQGPFAGILISDSGEGIEASKLPHIFDRFFQEDSKNSRESGSGIGLTIVRNLVNLHQGGIAVSSKKGAGSSFLVRLSLSDDLDRFRQDEGMEPAGRSEFTERVEVFENEQVYLNDLLPQQYKNIRVMVIEDEDDMRSYLEARLSASFIVRSFSRAGDALAMMGEFRPDLVVCDIMMPGMNGFDFCRAVKNNVETAQIPIIMLSARTAVEDLIEGAESLADQYITKPFNMRYLLVSIRSLLDNRINIIKKYKEDIYDHYGRYVKGEKEKELIDRVISIISKNLSDPSFSVDFIATEIGIGRTKLYKMVKEITDFNLGELIRDIKMKTAVQLMLTTDNKISEIANEVGISPNFFYTIFKEYFGTTPSEYMKAHQV